MAEAAVVGADLADAAPSAVAPARIAAGAATSANATRFEPAPSTRRSHHTAVAAPVSVAASAATVVVEAAETTAAPAAAMAIAAPTIVPGSVCDTDTSSRLAAPSTVNSATSAPVSPTWSRCHESTAAIANAATSPPVATSRNW